MARSVDLTQFAEIIRKLSSLSGKDLRTVMTAEAGKILETAVRYTPKADKKKITEQVARDAKVKFEGGKSDAGHVYVTKAGVIWFQPPGNDSEWYLIQRWRTPDAIWRQYLRALTKSDKDFRRTVDRRVKAALARRGLTAKTWVQLGKSLGVDVKAPGFIQSATIPDGIARGKVETTAKGVTVTGENSSGVLIRTRKGQGIIDRAVRARLRFMEIAIKNGALDTLASRTKSFPHLFREANRAA